MPPRVAALLAFILCVSGCAPRQPPRDVYAESTVHLRSGCYRCLEEGLALVDGRPDIRSRLRAFELAILLAARARELGLSFESWIERAKALSTNLPPAAAASTFLAIAGALRQDPAGLDRDEDVAQRRRAGGDDVRAWIASIASSAATDEVKLYFELAVVCGFFLRDERDAAAARATIAAPGVPLLEYALGSCTSSEEKWLLRALDEEPRFDDAAYPLGRYLLNRLNVRRPQVDPAAALARARKAFPESAAITFTEATFFRARRDWVRALDGFEATLRLVPRHHDARLGRVFALSMLTRHEEAIAGATSLIDEGRWLTGEAYYWRAWNHYTLMHLDDSERDVEQAKQRMRSSAVHVLSGLVQWRKRRPTVAESEFVLAVDMASDDCDASHYLGSVRTELRKWRLAADAFAQAETCRNGEVAELRATLTDLVTHGAPADAIESQQQAIATAEQEAAEMAYNRGAMLVNAGDVGEARSHIERAGRHPTLQSKAADLLLRLDRRQ